MTRAVIGIAGHTVLSRLSSGDLTEQAGTVMTDVPSSLQTRNNTAYSDSHIHHAVNNGYPAADHCIVWGCPISNAHRDASVPVL